VRHCPNRVIRFLTGMFLTLVIAAAPTTTRAQEQPFPLEPADTTSPRNTLANLIDNIVEAHRVLQAAAGEHATTSGLFKSDAVLEQEAIALVYLNRAVGSANLSEIPPATRQFVALEAILQLKEVLDRVPLPPIETIPNQQVVAAHGLTRWRVPHTSIDIVQVEKGPRAGEFLFDPL